MLPGGGKTPPILPTVQDRGPSCFWPSTGTRRPPPPWQPGLHSTKGCEHQLESHLRGLQDTAPTNRQLPGDRACREREKEGREGGKKGDTHREISDLPEAEAAVILRTPTFQPGLRSKGEAGGPRCCTLWPAQHPRGSEDFFLPE